MENYTYATVPTQFVDANGITFAYRSYGKEGGLPIIYFQHLAGTLDNADPRIMDGIAKHHQIISFDLRGIGATTGETPDSIYAMADDAIAFIEALGFDKVNVLAFSLGGFIAQEVLVKKPELINKIILAGTGPRGGEGISDVVWTTYWDMAKGFFTFQDPKVFLFFNRDEIGKLAAHQFIDRINERKENRDTDIKINAFQTQLKAIKTWGHDTPADLSVYNLPVFVVNGDNDRMVPTPNSYDLAKRFPNAELKIYEDAGHGGIFQYYEDFTRRALDFFTK